MQARVLVASLVGIREQLMSVPGISFSHNVPIIRETQVFANRMKTIKDTVLHSSHFNTTKVFLKGRQHSNEVKDD